MIYTAAAATSSAVIRYSLIDIDILDGAEAGGRHKHVDGLCGRRTDNSSRRVSPVAAAHPLKSMPAEASSGDSTKREVTLVS